MHTNMKAWIRYYRECLADEARIPDLTSVPRDERAEFDETAFQAGHVQAESIQHLLKVKSSNETVELQSVSVVACPWTLKLRERHGKVPDGFPREIVPLAIPCRLFKDGDIEPEEGLFPWIPRQHLAPQDGQKIVMLADVADQDSFCTRHRKIFGQKEWKDYLEFCDAFTDELLSTAKQEVLYVDGIAYEAVCEGFFVRLSQFSPTRNLQELHDDLLQQEWGFSLLETMLLGTEERASLDVDGEAKFARDEHLGHMTDRFSLGKSQRQTIHHFFSTADAEVLAVNGPPGTGKTTLLQSAVASLWVRSIVDEAKGLAHPPLIVATSNNNQAVLNVIRDFGKIMDEHAEDVLQRRWLPDRVHSLGTYAASKLSKDLDPSFQTIFREGKLVGYFDELETEAYVAQARRFFLEQFSSRFGPAETSSNECQPLSGARKRIRDEMLTVLAEMRGLFDKWKTCRANLKKRRDALDELGRCERAELILISEVEKVEASCEEAAQRATSARMQLADCKDAAAGEPFWEDWLLFLPLMRRRKKLRVEAYMARNSLVVSDPQPSSLLLLAQGELSRRFDETQLLLSKGKKRRDQAAYALRESEMRKDKARRTIKECESTYAESISTFTDMGLQPDFTAMGLYELSEQLDVKHRHQLFLLAVHYYEAAWLEDVENSEKNKTLSDHSRWTRLSMLTPCVVSTLFMLPKFFKSFNEYAYGTIDLLILDEAGQIAPDKGTAVFSLAKRALVVGDVHQIEPVYNIPYSVDFGNMLDNGIVPESPEAKERSASAGNLMRVAQLACPYRCVFDGRPAPERGMYLLEHRRCRNEIISFCKRLVYEHLDVHTKPTGDALFPPMAYAHVPSFGLKRGGSWVNEYEAQNLAVWLKANETIILEHYGEIEGDKVRLSDIVGIVTPFRAQANCIRSEIRKIQGAGSSEMKIGTVHTLQGAERPIVLFSSVYGPGQVGQPFFDKGPNMLNVAVSRAKDCCIIFGNMELFQPGTKTPSSILATHLFDSGMGHALPGFSLTSRTMTAKSIEHLQTLEQHRNQLVDGLATASSEVIITSPFLSMNAIREDQILDHISQAVTRGVKVIIFADAKLTWRLCNSDRSQVAMIAHKIRESGAFLKFVNGAHNKTMIVDDHLLVEGSFNWLSASRDDRFCRQEQSIAYHDAAVGMLKKQVLNALNGLIAQDQYTN